MADETTVVVTTPDPTSEPATEPVTVVTPQSDQSIVIPIVEVATQTGANTNALEVLTARMTEAETNCRIATETANAAMERLNSLEAAKVEPIEEVAVIDVPESRLPEIETPESPIRKRGVLGKLLLG